jgi:methylenetetrahydrofolate dehydrogenase (NADP+)/methenyltetrahydrofolate cyclohydrolase
MTIILDGKKLRDKIFVDLKSKIDKMSVKPTLAVILAGDNPASQIYVNNKKKTAENLGINSIVIKYPSSVSEEEILKKIDELNSDNSVNAILVQLPLPSHINKFKIIDSICPKKDVDGLTPYNSGKLFTGEKPFVYPCTPKGILLLLDEYNIELEGKHVVVIGRSNLVGKPVAQMLLNRNATVTTCHSKTKNLSEITKTADILISAVGKNVVGEKYIKNNCVVVDVGIFRDDEGNIRGDVDFENVSKHTSYISPVPGGVGPMTIASLMLNTVELANATLSANKI